MKNRGGIIIKTYIGCSVIIYDSDDRVLIAQRSRDKRRFPLLWETIGGALEGEETPENCIRRETKEEIGCNILDLELFKVYIIRVDEEQHVLIVFTGRIEEEIKMNYEIEDVRWISVEDLDKYEFYTDNCREKILDFFRS